jgi:heptaprenyl diphosphate synthase
MNTKKMAVLSAFTALSIVLNWMENLFFPWTVLPIPGVKIGLANVVFLVVFLLAGLPVALTLSVLRVLVIGVFSGTIATVVLPISLGGAVMSLIFVKIARTIAGERLSLIGLSVLGAVGHNLGQFGVLLSLPGLFPGISITYLLLPALILLALPAGTITGWIAGQLLPTLKREWEGL